MKWTDVAAAGATCQAADGIVFDTPTPSGLVEVPFPLTFCGRILRRSVVLSPTASAGSN